MIKEIKYLIFIIIIGLFLFFTGRYYFSDQNIKKSYRSFNQINEKIKIYSEDLPIIENDTRDIIEYVKHTKNKKKRKFNFWKLLGND